MTTLHIFGLLAWLAILVVALLASLGWVRTFLRWPGLTRQALLLGLLVRLLAIAVALAIIIGLPIDLAL